MDKGNSWTNIKPYGSNSLNAISINNFQVAVSGINDGLFTTSSYDKFGNHFENKYNYNLLDIQYISEYCIWGVGKGGSIYKFNPKNLSSIKLHSTTTADLTSVHFINDKIGFVAGDGTILKTTTNGDIWLETYTTEKSNEKESFRSIYFVDENNGWAVGQYTESEKGIILNTKNAGRSWEVQSFNSEKLRIINSVVFINKNFGWACGNNGIVLSTTNGGETWETEFTGVNNTLNDIYVSKNFEIYTVGSSGIMLKEPTKLKFLPIDSDEEKYYHNLKVDSTYKIKWESNQIESIKIEYSTGGAKNWKTIVDNYPAKNGFYEWRVPNTPSIYCKLRISSTSDSIYYDLYPRAYSDAFIDELQGLHFTIYGENKWTKIPTPSTSNLYDIKYINANEVIAWGKRSLIYSNDGGSTWELLSEFESDYATFVNKYEGWKVINNYEQENNSAIFHTNDGGFTWENISNIYRDETENRLNHEISHISFTNKQIGCISTTYGFTRNGYRAEMFITHDSGSSWNEIHTYGGFGIKLNIITPQIICSSIHEYDGTMNSSQLTFYSFDGGDSWGEVPWISKAEGHIIRSNGYFLNSNNGWATTVYSEGIGTFYKLTKNGWELIYESLGEFPSRIHFFNENIGWFYGDKSYPSSTRNSYICYTVDGGLTWEVQHFAKALSIEKFATFNNSHCLAVGGNNIYKSPSIIAGTNNEDETNNIIKDYSLSQNYPNPFNPNTKINFTLPKQCNVSVTVYNSLGEVVTKIIDKNLKAGKHNVVFNGENLASGIYFYRIKTINYIKTKKMILLK